VEAIPQQREASTSVLSVLLFWTGLLVVVGVVHRHGFGAANASSTTASAPNLDAVAYRLDKWDGVDVPMDSRVLAASHTDAHINRRYVNRDSRDALDLYVAFTHRPVNMLGHRPDVCYPANGWIADGIDHTTVHGVDGDVFDCLLHRFSRGDADGERLVVANYYVLPSGTTTDWNAFAGLQWRRRASGAEPAIFVAQVQVVGVALLPSRLPATVEMVERFTELVTPEILKTLASSAMQPTQPNSGAPSP